MVILLLALLLTLYNEAEQNTLEARETARVAIAANELDSYISLINSDLLMLAGTPALRQLALQDSPASRQAVTGLFQAFLVGKPLYNTIRYLDCRGMEIIRLNLVNGQPVAVPEAQLQNKADRYYVRETLQLAEGEIYVSPLDLSIENGQILQPHKPMIRFGTLLPDGQGQPAGVLILNLQGQILLDRFRQSMGHDYPALLLNRDGDWLVSPQPEQEWGFMYGQPGGFARKEPEVWKTMQNQLSGHTRGRHGLYVYTTVQPLQAADRASASPDHPDASYQWKVVSLIPEQALPLARLARSAVPVLGIPLLLAGLGGLAQLLASRQQLQQQILQAALLHQEITDNLGEGVIVLDRKGRVAEINPEGERLLGWTRQEIMGQEAHDRFHHHPASTATQCPILQVILDGQPYHSESEFFCRKDGQIFPVGLNAAPLTGSHGQIAGTVIAFRDITRLRQSQEQIRHMAYHDALTDLPNRRFLTEQLQRLLDEHQELALVFIDVDHFKTINDTYGHNQGDAYLKQVASLLQASIRSADLVIRQGGDEFIILLPGAVPEKNAEEVCRRLLEQFSTPITVGEQPLQVSLSLGIAVYPGSATTADGLMQQADAAMYRAKQAGRNTWSC